jgi:hypothetical protein
MNYNDIHATIAAAKVERDNAAAGWLRRVLRWLGV